VFSPPPAGGLSLLGSLHNDTHKQLKETSTSQPKSLRHKPSYPKPLETQHPEPETLYPVS